MGLSTQAQQCFGKGYTLISSRVGRGDEHLYGLVAPLFNNVRSGSSGLSGLSGWFSYLTQRNQTNETSETDQTNKTDAA
jgi:hypothetical protein